MKAKTQQHQIRAFRGDALLGEAKARCSVSETANRPAAQEGGAAGATSPPRTGFRAWVTRTLSAQAQSWVEVRRRDDRMHCLPVDQVKSR